MTDDAWEISAVEVSEVEATVRVSYRGPASGPAAIRGTLRGPYCERAHTLPADYPFRAIAGVPAAAEAIVTDPCLWSEEMPHVYHVDLEAVQGETTADAYHGVVGLRRTSPLKNFDDIK
jgi:Glycosyl hydrolases family 2